MISLSKRDTLEYTSADVLVRCDDRDSLRHANSVREQVQRQPPRSRASLSSASALPAPPVCFSFPRQRSCSRATFIASRTSRNYPTAKSAPPTCAPHVCARARAPPCMTRPCPPHGRGHRLKNKKVEKKNDEMRTRNRDGGKFPSSRSVDATGYCCRCHRRCDDIFLVNNENFCRPAEGTRALRRSSYNVSFFFSFPRGSARLRIMMRFQSRGCSTVDVAQVWNRYFVTFELLYSMIFPVVT